MEMIQVVCAIIRRGDKVLIAKRPAGKQYGGMWEFPGGKVEAVDIEDGGEEYLHYAVQREIMEELGVEVDVVETLGVFNHASDTGVYELNYFICELYSDPERWPKPDEEPQPLQCDAIEWVRAQQLWTWEAQLCPMDAFIAKYLSYKFCATGRI